MSLRTLVLVAALAATVGASLSACADPQDAKNLATANAFLKGNAHADGVVTLPDGLEYRVVTPGAAGGPRPRADDQVVVNYEGKLLDDTVFDSSFQRGQPAVFVVDQLVPAWTEALQRMRPGDEWILYVPPKLAYGDHGAGPIPPNSLLIFRLQLISIMPKPAAGAASGGG